MTVEIFEDKQALARTVAEQIVALSQEKITAKDRFSIGLSGGSTPQPVFELLASATFTAYLDWEHIHVFWGDERCVPPDHAGSNYRMARETLLDHVPIPASNIHRMQGETNPPTAAAKYENTLRTFFEDVTWPRFDLLVQGLGDDGHTASLFPNTTALSETTRWVVANHVPKLDSWRLTLTAPVINAATQVWFLVTGEKKATALHNVLHGPHQPTTYPAQLIQPSSGELVWFVDAAAAKEL